MNSLAFGVTYRTFKHVGLSQFQIAQEHSTFSDACKLTHSNLMFSTSTVLTSAVPGGTPILRSLTTTAHSGWCQKYRMFPFGLPFALIQCHWPHLLTFSHNSGILAIQLFNSFRSTSQWYLFRCESLPSCAYNYFCIMMTASHRMNPHGWSNGGPSETSRGFISSSSLEHRSNCERSAEFILTLLYQMGLSDNMAVSS